MPIRIKAINWIAIELKLSVVPQAIRIENRDKLQVTVNKHKISFDSMLKVSNMQKRRASCFC